MRLFKGSKKAETELTQALEPQEEMTAAQKCASDLIMLTARLAQVLATEADFLEEMKVSRIAELQDEKIRLTRALEAIKKQINKDASILEQISDEQREDLHNVISIFNVVLEENYERLSMARLVNQKIIEAISEVVCETAKNDVYDHKGSSNHGDVEPISLTVNERA